MAWLELKIFLALLALPAIAQQPATYTLEKEQAMGKALASDVRKRLPQFDNPTAAEYVNSIGKGLIDQLNEQIFSYSFELVVSADTSEPMAIPGGYIFIPATFFLVAQDEHEFAGMLAHAIGHIALRQHTRMATRAQQSNMGTVPLIFIGTWMGSHVDSRSLSPLIPVGFMEYQRLNELDADAFGIDLAARSGYDPAAFRRYVERTQQPSDSRVSPLPQRELRLTKIDEILGQVPTPPSIQSTEYQRIQDLVRAALPKRPKPTLYR